MLQNSPFHLGDVRLMVGLSNLRVFSNLKDSMILFYDPCFLGNLGIHNILQSLISF